MGSIGCSGKVGEGTCERGSKGKEGRRSDVAGSQENAALPKGNGFLFPMTSERVFVEAYCPQVGVERDPD